MILNTLATALLLSGAIAPAQQWHVDGQAVGDASDHKVVNGFGAYLILVPRPIDVIEEYAYWQKGDPPQVPFVECVTDGEKFGAVVLCGGCEQHPNDGCQLSVEYRVYGPDGTLYTERVEAPQWTAAEFARRTTVVATTTLPLSFTAVDARGTYRVVATLRDANRGASMELETKVVLEESVPDDPTRPN